MALNKADANTQVDTLIADNVSNEISELDVRTCLKQNIDANMNLDEPATQEMSGSIDMGGFSIFNVANFAPGTSINEDHGAIIMTANATQQSLVASVPQQLLNFTANGPDQNTSPNFAFGEMSLDNSGVWLVGFSSSGKFDTDDADLEMAITLNGVRTAAIARDGIAVENDNRYMMSGVAPVLVTSGQVLQIEVESDTTGNLVAEDSILWAVRCAESEITQDLVDQINRGAYTGWIEAPNLTVNAGDNTQFDISAGNGIHVDHSDPSNVIVSAYSTPGIVGTAGTLLGSAVRQTFVSINSSGTVIQRSEPLSVEQAESELFIGNLTHGDGGSPPNDIFDDATDTPLTDYSAIKTFRMFLRSLRGINLEGLQYTGVTGTTQIQHSSGQGLVLGRNYFNDKNFPDTPTAAAQNPVPALVYKYEDTSGDLITIGPVDGNVKSDVYNNNGVLTTVPNNDWTIQRLFFFYGSNTTIIYVGNGEYDSLDEARAAISSEEFTEHPDTFEGVFRGYLLIQDGCTDTDDPLQAEFRAVGGIRPFGGSQGISQTVDRQDAYDNGKTVLVNGTTGPIVDQVDPTGADTDLLWEGKNTSGTTTSSIAGDGTFSVMSLTATDLINLGSYANLAAFPAPSPFIEGSIAYDLDTQEVYYCDGSAWISLTDAGGGGLPTYTQVFNQTRNSTQVINNLVEATLICDVAIDTAVGSAYDPLTGITTATDAGLWEISACGNILVNGTNSPPVVETRLIRGNPGDVTLASFRQPYGTGETAGNFGFRMAPMPFRMAVGDTARIAIFNETGQTIAVQPGDLMLTVKYLGG